jgi:hypothetical protein
MNCDFPGNDIGQMTLQTGNVTFCLNYCKLQGIIFSISCLDLCNLKYQNLGSVCSHVVYDSTGVTGVTPGNCSLKYKSAVSTSEAVVSVGLFCGIMI